MLNAVLQVGDVDPFGDAGLTEDDGSPIEILEQPASPAE